MRRRPRRTAVVGAVAVAILGVAACSNSDNATGPRVSSTTRGSQPPASTTSQAPGKPVSITMVMSGDVLLHQGLWKTAQQDARRTGHGHMDYRPILANMRRVVSSADFAICHLETPLAPRGGPYSGYPLFSVPPQILPALKWEGYDACTTMSNHSLDQGWSGLKRTIGDFNRIGLKHFGTVTTKAASRNALMVTVKGVKVALIGATYGTNGIPLPAAEPWSVPIINITRILRMAHRARVAGAKIVIVALHWGQEYDHMPTSEQRTLAESLTRSPDISFIYGHHAHVVQPYDKLNGTWVVYGLGNAIARQDPMIPGVYEGNTCRVTFTQQPDGSFTVTRLQYIPTIITPYDYGHPIAHPMRWLDVPRDITDPTYGSRYNQLVVTEARVRADVNLLGALRQGVTQGG